MDLDSYETPVADQLLRSAKQRHAEQRNARRVLVTEVVSAAVFLTAAGLVAALSHWAQPLSLWSRSS